MRLVTECLLFGALLVCLVGAKADAAARESVDLDGVWSFATDPGDKGEAEGWFKPETALPSMPLPGYAPEANGTIRVPGIWDNQGYGIENDKLRHQFVGKGWYKRQVEVPANWSGQRLFLVITGVCRSAKVWVNGEYLGEHIGFVSAFEWDVTERVAAGQAATIVIAVDSLQHWETDALFGASSFTDYMETPWGGIWGHVRLEARPSAWLSDLYLESNIHDGSCTATACMNGQGAGADSGRLELFDMAGARVAEAAAKVEVKGGPGEQTVRVTAKVPDAKLWTPDTPTLYLAKLSLFKGNDLIDTVESRFGMREFTVDGYQLLLNGKRIMLLGYGDDHIYPEQMAMPSDKELYLQRLRLIKSYGFNHVRHHSTMMPPEYYEACDEVGILANAEFPIVYSRYLPGSGSHWKEMVKPGTDPAVANGIFVQEWIGGIKRYRNHPSILAWVMGNELYGGIPLREDFQREKDRLDPGRFFVDSDGVWGFDVSADLAKCVPPGDTVNLMDPKNDRDTLDLYFMQAVDPITYDLVYPTVAPKKPVIVHEMGNFLTFPRPDIVGLFQQNIKPFWLTDGEAKLKALGLYDEAPQWAEKSERLYSALHKENIEKVRKNPYLSGYHWWLFQDYWTTSNGLVDQYFRPKSITPEEVLKYNSPVVLLQDGLARTYEGRETLMVRPMVSNYSDDAIESEMTWKVMLGTEVLAEKRIAVQVGQGELKSLDAVTVELPDVAAPTRLRITAEMSAGGKNHANEWSARVYPSVIPPIQSAIPYTVMTEPPPADQKYSEDAVCVTQQHLDAGMIDAMEQGAVVVLLGGEEPFWPSYPVSFGTTWWKAGDSPKRNHTGTFVYDHPITRAVAPDGWCDEGWFRLLDGATKYVLDDMPSRPNVIIRALPSMVRAQDSALLFEVGVGKGCLIVCGLKLIGPGVEGPETEWLMKQLVEYAGTRPAQKVQWPASVLLDAIKR